MRRRNRRGGLAHAEADLEHLRGGAPERVRKVERGRSERDAVDWSEQRQSARLRGCGAALPQDVAADRAVRGVAHDRATAQDFGVISPSVGELGLAEYSFFGVRPARQASRPASTLLRIAWAMSTGSRAFAMAVFISTASHPSSIAIAASEAVPTPASTMIGTVAFSRMSWRFHGLRIPMPEPISEASGITATQPIPSSSLAMIGSSLVYTITLKPSFTSVAAACSVAMTFGKSV